VIFGVFILLDLGLSLAVFGSWRGDRQRFNPEPTSFLESVAEHFAISSADSINAVYPEFGLSMPPFYERFRGVRIPSTMNKLIEMDLALLLTASCLCTKAVGNFRVKLFGFRFRHELFSFLVVPSIADRVLVVYRVRSLLLGGHCRSCFVFDLEGSRRISIF
jgi:hypothetical protein